MKYGIHCISSRSIQMSFHKRKHCILSGSDYLYSNHHNKQYIYLQILGIYKYHIMYIYIPLSYMKFHGQLYYHVYITLGYTLK